MAIKMKIANASKTIPTIQTNEALIIRPQIRKLSPIIKSEIKIANRKIDNMPTATLLSTPPPPLILPKAIKEKMTPTVLAKPIKISPVSQIPNAAKP